MNKALRKFLMRKGQDDFLEFVNSTIDEMKKDGSLKRLCEQYGLVCAYSEMAGDD